LENLKISLLTNNKIIINIHKRMKRKKKKGETVIKKRIMKKTMKMMTKKKMKVMKKTM